jgi:spore germination protein YaaH
VLTRTVFGYHPYWVGENFQNYDFTLLSHVAYFSAEADPATGNITNSHNWSATGLIAAAQAAQTNAVLTATCIGSQANATLLADPQKRTTLVQALVQLALQQNASGITVDFEQAPQTQRNNLSSFVSELAVAARAAIAGGDLSRAAGSRLE